LSRLFAVYTRAVLGGRSFGFVLRNALEPRNYRAVAAMPRRFPQPTDALRRYLLAHGRYPHDQVVQTPIGDVQARLYSPHDFITLVEMFCREDYAASEADGVIVDIGSNIGLSALYFLTRGPQVRCHLFEPVPRNVERLRHNLTPYHGRYTLQQVAVADRAGELSFGVEDTGRYGGLDRELPQRITVTCRHINDVLEDVLTDAGRIDILKLDTEGSEPATLEAIRPDLLARVGRVYLELENRAPRLPAGWRRHVACQTMRLDNPEPVRSR
jgi:FkbM family methyltransferase